MAKTKNNKRQWSKKKVKIKSRGRIWERINSAGKILPSNV
jgi:hypothetical protein